MTEREAQQSSASQSASDREVIFEIRQIGGAQRVAAIDVATGLEVVIQAPANAALVDVQALALRKLDYALASAQGREAPPDAALGAKRAPPRPGKLV